MSIDIGSAIEVFRSHYGFPPTLMARAPGRVNIIGEHTDYNHGFVLPMAIEQETVILARARQDLQLQAFAANLGRETVADLRNRIRNPQEPWIDYLVGVADELVKLGKSLQGADIVILGDVPIGAGLSSSASLEMATLVMFEAFGGFSLQGAEAPKLGKRVENDYLGVNSGIMDQFVVRMAEPGHALFLDCRSHEYELVPVAFPDARFVVADTRKSRGLADSKYNERVAECGEAVRIMRARLGCRGTHLRDFRLDQLESCSGAVPEMIFRRARHVITENDRTKAACLAMKAGDVRGLGALMDQSHASLRDDYEVTCEELDVMVESAQSINGCYGARMTGAGFGGCTVNLVASDRVERFCEALLASYGAGTGREGGVIVSSPGAGAGQVPVQ